MRNPGVVLGRGAKAAERQGAEPRGGTAGDLFAGGGRAADFLLSALPPLYQGYQCPEILAVLEKYQVKRCYYGHLHGPTIKRRMEGSWRGISFSLISADHLGFCPKKICDAPTL